MKFIIISLFSYSLFTSEIIPQSIEIHKRDAAVWSREQNINGRLNGFFNSEVTLFLNDIEINAAVNFADSSFSIPVILNEGISRVLIKAGAFESDTLKLTLGYNIRPEIYAYAAVNGRDVNLHAAVIENPDTSALSFLWIEDVNNPAHVSIGSSADSAASFSLSANLPYGEYYFDLLTFSSKGDTVKSRTFVILDSNGIRPFDIKNDYASWIDSVVIYQITPYIFANGNQSNDNDFNTITNKISDFVRLGVNTIWLQPVYKTYYGGQGYDVIDYFGVRSDAGSVDELKNLIQTAKAGGLKIIFDFVPNHSSIRHPYAQSSVQYGKNSHYYDFYQREEDTAPYSQHYHHYQGFINYFWNELPNLNYDNPEVRKWITEAAAYWIREFDVDGYRFDAVWGVNARRPEFMKELRLVLKRIKPEILMLAEDKATRPETFDENFDAAYDWYPEESWVSHWTWQTDYNPDANPTIFNYQSQSQRSNLLRDAITNNGNGFSPDAKVLRFLENNDLFHFITHHGLNRTKMAAALEFTLHGIPLIYNGQDIGVSGHPYETEFIFYPGYPLDYDDQYNLFDYYQNLIKWRKKLPALYKGDYQEISVSPGNSVFAFRRWSAVQNIFIVLNMGSAAVNANLVLPVSGLNLDSSGTYYLTDLITGEVISGLPENLSSVQVSLNAFTTKILFLTDSIVQVTGIRDVASDKPGSFELLQNYPNPFNPSTNIKFNLPSAGKVVLKVYDILGNEIAEIVSGNLDTGPHSFSFNAENLSSGVYIYRIEHNNRMISKKMILLK